MANLAKRAPDGRFLPGTPSPNPGGRPKGALRFARDICAATDGDRLLWEGLLQLAGIRDGRLEIAISVQERRLQLDALKELCNRRFGKALQQLEISSDSSRLGETLDDLPPERLVEVARLLFGDDDPVIDRLENIVDAEVVDET